MMAAVNGFITYGIVNKEVFITIVVFSSVLFSHITNVDVNNDNGKPDKNPNIANSTLSSLLPSFFVVVLCIVLLMLNMYLL